MNTMNPFFIQENYIDVVADEEYEQVSMIIDSVRASSCLTYQSFYVIDYFKRNFPYVSDNPLFLCGSSPQEVREKGFAFYNEHIPPDEVDMLHANNREGFRFFRELPVEVRLKSFISYDFHILNTFGKTLINHKLMPIRLAKNGNIWLALCLVSIAAQKDVGNIEVYLGDQDNSCWTYSVKSGIWKQKEVNRLQERELEILLHAAKGYNTAQMADKMCISKNTVKYHRKKIFKKLAVDSMSEAIMFAIEKKLI